VPDKTGKLGDRGLRIKAVDIANLSNDSGGVNLANAGNGSECVWDNFKLLLNGLVRHFDLFLQCPHGGDRYRHCLVHRVIHGNWQTVRISGCTANSLSFCYWVSEVPALFINEESQFIQIGVCQIIHCFKLFHECNGGGAGILNILLLSNTGAFQE